MSVLFTGNSTMTSWVYNSLIFRTAISSLKAISWSPWSIGKTCKRERLDPENRSMQDLSGFWFRP